MKIRLFGFLVLAALAALAAWIIILGQAIRAQAELPGAVGVDRMPRALEFGGKNVESFFQYNDSKYGFTLNYPLGYEVYANPAFEECYLELGRGIPGALALLDVCLTVTRVKTARELRDDVIRDLKAAGATRITQEEETIEGEKAYFLEAEGEDVLTDENMLYRFGFYSCRDLDGGDYFVSLSASMSFDLLPELKFVDYVLYSFKC